MSERPATKGQIVNFTYELNCKAHEAWDNGYLDTAVRMFRQLARMGEVDAMVNLGTMLDDRITPPDPQGAIYWYMRAFRAGDEAGAWNLAMHYIPRGNLRWYRFWMAKAEEMGEEDAIVEMAKIRADPNYMTKLPLED